MLAVVFSIFISQLVIQPAIDSVVQHWTYGGSLVSYVKADVGHGGVSSIYALRVKDTAEIIVITGQRVEAYQVPLSTPGSIVLVSVQDVNSDGKPDLVIHPDGSDVSTVLYNNGHTFQARPWPFSILQKELYW
jgi:hypothetical protein